MQPTNETKITKKPFYKRPKFIKFIVIPYAVLTLTALIVAAANYETDSSLNSSPAGDTQSKEVTTNNEDSIPYEVFESWDLPNGFGNTIIIETKYDNEADLKKLGELLNEQSSSSYFAYIGVYSDKTAATYRKTPFCKEGQSKEVAELNKYFAALYTKGHDGAEYSIFTDRECGNDSQNTIISFPS